MSYYVFEPHQVYGAAGFGATAGISFNGAQVWADWVECDKAWQLSKTAGTPFRAPASCQRSVDAIRAALGQLGYGGLSMGMSWGSGDQAAWKQWAADAGSLPNRGMPTKDGLAVMDAQLAKGVTPGGETPIAYEKVGDQYVEKGVLEDGVAKAGIDWSTWGLIGLGAAGIVAVAIVASKKKGKKTARPVRPGLAGPPASASIR
jgi:hypothetical protein